jgi:hypothetical protein
MHTISNSIWSSSYSKKTTVRISLLHIPWLSTDLPLDAVDETLTERDVGSLVDASIYLKEPTVTIWPQLPIRATVGQAT